MTQVMTWVSFVAVTVVTLWILTTGYKVITGQMRESLMAVVVNMTRIACIVTVAASMSVGSASIHDLFASQLPTALNQLFTGSTDSIPDTINKNLALTVTAMSAIDAVQAPSNDVVTVTQKARATDLAIFGTASPPMAAGAMLLMYNFAIALVVGLGPLFILCLIFDQTKPLFQKWLMYGIGTVFSLAMLSFISTIVLNVTARAAAALWGSNLINNMIGTNSEGLSTQSLEQGGIGLLMTMLIISVPPMAGNFFSATLGNFNPYNVFSRAGQPGPAGQPPGSYGYGGHGPSQAGIGQTNAGQLTGTGGFNTLPSSASYSGAHLSNSGFATGNDVTKQGGGLANPLTGR
ncbi:type IV secretion system protein [Rhodanobacter sp. DHB23]|nr:type IV secretion system protein [Rhodanobacter sp. DHB23]